MLGSDIAGVVDEVGDGVTRFGVGDEVYGDNLALMGGFAEYAVAAESSLLLKPAGLTFAEASTIPQAGIRPRFDLASNAFVPVDFEPPTSLVTDEFRLEPLGPQHNESDHAAWTSSIGHIRATPGFTDGSWPPRDGMTLEKNLSDLRGHADGFTARRGFTFTVLDPNDHDVIVCVYIYPSKSEDWDVTVHSWVRADRSSLDVPLADAVARWLAADWPWERVDRRGR